MGNLPPADFLVIQTRHGYSLRLASALYGAGQQCPLVEVPGPLSKAASNHARDFLQVNSAVMYGGFQGGPRLVPPDAERRHLRF